jgi:glycosyltransferase involved in cell wall biosynthesis
MTGVETATATRTCRAPRVMRNPCIRMDCDPATLPRISVVTACRNHAAFLEATLHSILDQGYPNLEYIVMDGDSDDGSQAIIARYADYLTHWQSGRDAGQYHAIQAGFERTTGDIMLWLNADDMLHRNALWTIASIFRDLPQVDWIMGAPTLYDTVGRVIFHRTRLHWSRVRYLRGKYRFIQQESVAWRRRLWERAGGSLDLSYSLAADMELWMRFFRHAKLHTALALIGGFRKVPGQRSNANLDAYLAECEQILAREPRTPADIAALRRFRLYDRLWFRLPLIRSMWRVRYAYQKLFEYPPLIACNHETGRFELKPEVPTP